MKTSLPSPGKAFSELITIDKYTLSMAMRFGAIRPGFGPSPARFWAFRARICAKRGNSARPARRTEATPSLRRFESGTTGCAHPT